LPRSLDFAVTSRSAVRMTLAHGKSGVMFYFAVGQSF
jgi:hypothetical protein